METSVVLFLPGIEPWAKPWQSFQKKKEKNNKTASITKKIWSLLAWFQLSYHISLPSFPTGSKSHLKLSGGDGGLGEETVLLFFSEIFTHHLLQLHV